VSIELTNFRAHLDDCRGVPSDLRSYLSWMEQRWWPAHRLHGTVIGTIASRILSRLDADQDDRDGEDRDDTTVPPPGDDGADENERRNRARERVDLERAKLERMKRTLHARRRHSVLEDISL